VSSRLSKRRREGLLRPKGTSHNQFINAAVAEKLSALETEGFFKERAKAAKREDFIGFSMALG
jgi:hypothetical protein